MHVHLEFKKVFSKLPRAWHVYDLEQERDLRHQNAEKFLISVTVMVVPVNQKLSTTEEWHLD
jgi:hypothetical protein